MVCNNGGSSLEIALTQRSFMRQPHNVTRLHDLQLRKTKNSLDALQCLCFFLGVMKQLPNAGHGSKKTSLSPSLMQLPELKRAVTCGKNSGCRLPEQWRSEFAYELHSYFSSKCSSTIISLAKQLS